MSKKRQNRKSSGGGGCGILIGWLVIIALVGVVGAALAPQLCGVAAILLVVAYVMGPMFAPAGRR